jgi:hypothetical protein
MPDYHPLALETVAEQIANAMRNGAYSEDLAQEIDRMLTSHATEDRDAVEDMTLADIITRAAHIRARSRIEAERVEGVAMRMESGE